ncbi:hypothetical protein B0H13DRAFT_2173372 [Mycena leptocephala]|nr:hypothetical protein B0H13DRAFT_2173372 [Mycena leptocephala]
MAESGVPGQSSSFIPNSGGRKEAPILKSGDVVLTAEAIQALKKMDILRMERNEKRGDRRKAGEENVSDDEGEPFAPYTLVFPSGDLPPAHGGLESTNSAPASNFLFDDDAAAANSFEVNDNSIPSSIFYLAKNGISPPLTLFLPASLARIRSSNIKTVKHGTGETTKVTVIDATWFTCYNTFLTFMGLAAGPRILEGFAAHYNHILTDPELSQWYPAYRSFDQGIRARFFTTPFVLKVKNEEYRAALQSAKNSFLISSRAPPKEKGERSKPYDRDDSTRKKTLLCFRCGRSGHGAVTCDQTEPSRHGRAFVITASRDGLFRISDKRAVCMGFNCGRDAHHGAVDCTRN